MACSAELGMSDRRHYSFAAPDQAVTYGHQICNSVGQGEGYAQVMADVKRDVIPNNESSANYVVSYAVNLLCPAQTRPIGTRLLGTSQRRPSQVITPSRQGTARPRRHVMHK